MERRLASILAADVVGYSRLIRHDEEGTVRALQALIADVFEPTITSFRGRVVKLMGDGILSEFSSVVDAVNCAWKIQEQLNLQNKSIPEDRRIHFRIGINLGDVIVDGADVQGDGVNIAARLETLSKPGGMCVSAAVFEQVRDRLDLVFEDLGEQTVKNIDRPVRVYSWAPFEAPPRQQGPISEEALPLPDKPSLAVLPFNNLSGDSDQEFFADGISEDLTAELARLRWFFVIARNSAFAFKGRSVNVKQIAQELGVRYIIEGSFRKAGDRIRVTVQLIDAFYDRHIWAERIDRELVDIFAVQDEIVQKISAAIEPKLLEAESIQSSKRSGSNLDAWSAVVQARSRFWKVTETESKTAIKLLEQALIHNPDYGPAHSALSFSLLFLMHMGWLPPGEILETAKYSARKAAEIDDLDPWAYVSLGYLAMFNKETDRAIGHFSNAIELNPSFAAAYGWRGSALAFGGRTEEAAPDLSFALRLSPLDPQNAFFYGSMGVLNYLSSRYETALEYCNKCIELRPDFVGGNRLHCATLSQLGHHQEAAAAFSRVLELQPNVSASLLRDTVPYAQKDDLEHFLAGLKMAGMPD